MTRKESDVEKIEQVSIELLIPYANNARTHSDAQVAQIAASIREFGFTNPVLTSDDNTIIAGHGRVMAARKLGLTQVPVIRLSHLSETQRKAYILADNKLALNAGWDDNLLSIELADLKDLGFDTDLTGFSADEIAALMPIEVTEGLTDEDEVPEVPDEPVTKLGDVWLLGKHRVMCGDSTSIDSVDKLMNGQKADMVFTDPPYNVNFTGALSSTSKNGKLVKMSQGYVNPSSTHDEIRNDRMDKSEFHDFMLSVLSVIKTYCIGGYYVCFSSSTLDELLAPLVETGIGWKSIIIWNKNQSPMGGGHFRRKYEPIAYGYFENRFYGREYAEDDVWDVDRTRKNDLHPTMKPVELIEKAIGYSTWNGQSVLDLFGGSGSTLIACEKTGRTARLIELDPKYCDVIVKRWQDFTGKTATLEETGKSFNELSDIKNARQAA
jgi:DNA modification methylase